MSLIGCSRLDHRADEGKKVSYARRHAKVCEN